MSGMVDLRGGYGNKQVMIAKGVSGNPALAAVGEKAARKPLLHMEPANPDHRKIWGAPARMLVVGRGEKLPAARVLLPTRRQWANWGGGAAVAVGGKKMMDRNVGKRDGRDRRKAVAGGAIAGLGTADLATNVAGWGTREGIKYHESLVNAGKINHPMSRKQRTTRLNEHKALHGVGSNTKDAPQAYYREWPHELPGSKARRLMGWKNHPPVVGGILGAGAVTGAGVALARSRKKSPVSKARPFLKPTGGQLRAWGGGAALTAGAGAMAHRNREKGNRGRATVIGAGAGAIGADTLSGVAQYGLREANQHALRKPENKQTSASRKIQSDHKASLGIKHGDKLPHRYFSEYPLELPGARTTRALARVSGKTGVAVTAATGAAVGGALGSRKKKVAKAEHTRDRRRAALSGAAAATGGTTALLGAIGYGEARSVEMKRGPSAAYGGVAAAGHLIEPFKPGNWKSSGSRRALAMGHGAPAVGGAAVAAAIGGRKRRREPVHKVDTTMSDHDAHRLAQRYDTRGPLPKGLSRDQKMKAYEARYIASGGKKAEKWKHRADAAEVGRNIGLAGVTAAGAATIGRKAPLLRKIPRHHIEHLAVGAGTFGGASELYGEHARSRRASYQSSPGGVAGSALSRMQAYTPEKKR